MTADSGCALANYCDEGLFAFKPTVTINKFAALPLTYTVVNQYGTNPVWMTIEIDTGVLGDRSDNTTFQMVPAPYGSTVYTMVDAETGTWFKWNNDSGDITGNPGMALSAIATNALYSRQERRGCSPGTVTATVRERGRRCLGRSGLFFVPRRGLGCDVSGQLGSLRRLTLQAGSARQGVRPLALNLRSRAQSRPS